MSTKSYTRNKSMHFTLYCSWTVAGKKIRHAFNYIGTLTDAINQCHKNMIGTGYPDFRIYSIDFKED